MYAILILCLVTLVEVSSSEEQCDADSGKEWSYHYPPTDPSQWSTLFEDNCGGDRQSPIDIDTKSVKDSNRDLLNIQYDDTPISSATMENTGSTIKITPLDMSDGFGTVTRDITSQYKYQLKEIHFHWGSGETNSPGSEHTLNGERYDMEIHFVHYAEDYDFYANIAIFVKAGGSSNSVFQTISDALGDVEFEGDSTTIENLDVKKLLPGKGAKVYYYLGTLTTPTCDAFVQWFVFPTPIEISDEQYAPFHEIYTVKDEDPNCKMDGNFRPTQPNEKMKVNSGKVF